MSDQTAPTLTRETVIAAINTAAAAVKSQIDSKTSFDMPLKNVRKKLSDFAAKHGRMPATLGELASLQVTELTRFKFIAAMTQGTTHKRLDEDAFAAWPFSQLLTEAAKLDDATMVRIPQAGPATLAMFYVVRDAYTALGLHTAPVIDAEQSPAATAPLVAAWRTASAGLDKMDVMDRLGFLLTQSDDIIAANSRKYFNALEKAAEAYYGNFLTEDLIGRPANLNITRHIVARHIETARLGRSTITVLQPYIGKLAQPHQVAFIRSYMAAIHEELNGASQVESPLDELPLKIKMLGRLDLKIPGSPAIAYRHDEPSAIKQKRQIAAEVVGLASKALEVCVDTHRITDAFDIIDGLKSKVSDAVVVTDESFQRLLDKVHDTRKQYPLTEYQEMHERLMGFAAHRETLQRLTTHHSDTLAKIKGEETGVRAAMMDRLAERLTAKPDAGPKRT